MKKIDSVWIGVAVLTYNICLDKINWTLDDIFFSEKHIVDFVEKLIGSKIPKIFINENTKYLVKKEEKTDIRFGRLSYTGEFSGENERPDFSEMKSNINIDTAHGKVSIDTLIKFVENIYSPRIKKLLSINDKVKINNNDRVVGVVTMNEIFSPNLILYGPPGTGKTYNSVIYAVAICEGKKIENVACEEYEAVKLRYENLKATGRIAFTTFHQSYGYEEFIEGIRPVMSNENEDVISENNGQLRYRVESGVFKKFCNNAKKISLKTDKFDKFSFDKDTVVWKVTIKEEVKQDCFVNNRVRIEWRIGTDGAAGFVKDMKKGDLILTTDGSRKIINGIAVVISEEAVELESEENNKTTRNVKWLATEISEDITSINSGKMLHRMTCARVPKMLVEDVVAIAMKKNTKLVETKNNKPYVFIIDEINRGNISKIFGELITLIEDTKRLGKEEQTFAVLPYSREEFSVPANVYILGTMNTADRSIAIMDTALRRRFSFIEKMPQPQLLDDVNVEQNGISVNIGEILDIINKRIEFLFDREHTIGHAFFMKLKNKPDINILADIFKRSVVPLLQEYFYEDYEKIQLILGDNGKIEDKYKFIKNETVIPNSLFRGRSRLEKANKYEINDEAFQWINSYAGIINSIENNGDNKK